MSATLNFDHINELEDTILRRDLGQGGVGDVYPNDDDSPDFFDKLSEVRRNKLLAESSHRTSQAVRKSLSFQS